MINEEGGVDPEQFRMEAMFDRMDAIGKSVLGLTIQCAQCHNHKFDPLTQEDYYRMFAFLNNDHEANIAVYTPDEQREAGRRAPARSAKSKQACSTHARLARADGRLGSRRPQRPAGLDGREPARDLMPATAASITCSADGSILAQGYAPTKHTREFTCQDRRCRSITAFRLELLNDPNLPLSGPGRSIKARSR